MVGVFIREGLSDWQIIQQEGGTGRFSLSGTAVLPDGREDFGIAARVIAEDTGMQVTDWITAEASKPRHAIESGELVAEWEITDIRVPAGGLYKLETGIIYPGSAREWAVRGEYRYHFGAGDIYVIAGQSNSAGYGREPASDPAELGVHLFRNSERWELAMHPMNDMTGAKHTLNLEFANCGHSPYLSFARYLKRELGYPVGLVQASLGGSPLSRWNPAENPDLYDNMMSIIKKSGGFVRGILWYQGCSDTGAAESASYCERFMHMVGASRRDLVMPELPWLTVQLNRHHSGGTDVTSGLNWPAVREAQRSAAHNPGVYIVPAFGSSLNDEIHNSSSANIVIGERLARLALECIYGRRYGFTAKAPDLISAVREGASVRLKFANAQRIDCFRIRPEMINDMYRVTDSSGVVSVTAVQGAGDCVVLALERELGGRAEVTLAPSSDPQGVIPIEANSWLPLLAFTAEVK